MAEAPRLRGLYAIADGGRLGDRIEAAAAAALAGGAVLLQYRDKRADAPTRRARAERLARLCARAGVPFIVNDDPELARAVGAAGVHLGRDDPDPTAARARLGPGAIVGVSCYDDLERAARAAAAGADYLAFGSVYPSGTKPEAGRVTLETLAAARRAFDRPLCAIGGIRADNAAPLLAVGVDLLAVVGGLFDEPDVTAAARRLSALFHPAARKEGTA